MFSKLLKGFFKSITRFQNVGRWGRTKTVAVVIFVLKQLAEAGTTARHGGIRFVPRPTIRAAKDKNYEL